MKPRIAKVGGVVKTMVADLLQAVLKSLEKSCTDKRKFILNSSMMQLSDESSAGLRRSQNWDAQAM
jgi:hypothetical protein